jgi:cysteine desulfurase family protein
MHYFDNAATTFPKPDAVYDNMDSFYRTYGVNVGRAQFREASVASHMVDETRELILELFHASNLYSCVFTSSATEALNIILQGFPWKQGMNVYISPFEHNAVLRPLHGIGANIRVAGEKLFDWEDTIASFEKELQKGVKAAVFTHVSNVFGYILPIDELSDLCRKYGVPFVIDAAQSAGSLPVKLRKTGADFIAMPGHKGLLGPQGTGLLLCARQPDPLLYGGTGSYSANAKMPDWLPDRLEAGTLNVPGIAGLEQGLMLSEKGMQRSHRAALREAERTAEGLSKMGCRVYSGSHQSSVVSFVPPEDCETFADKLASVGIGVRAGLHCAPLAHQSAGTIDTGTVRISFGHDAAPWQTSQLLTRVKTLLER